MSVLPLRLVPRAPLDADSREQRSPALSFELVRGTLLELSGDGASARTTTAVHLAREAQQRGEPVVWIERDDEGVYEADLAAAGLDLGALVFARVDAREGAATLFRAAEVALRSGSFGMAYVDLGRGEPAGPPGKWQGRLLGLVREHQATVVIASRRSADAASLGPLVSLRVVAERLSRVTRGAPFEVALHVVKSKRGDVRALASAFYDAPVGM